jgi:tetratricopeptide (TPR) repeat protein
MAPKHPFLKRTLLLTILFAAYGVLLFAPAAATLQELQVGMDAPDFSLKDMEGKTGNFASLRGEKLTIVIFWSTWDRKSAKALARMQQLYQKYRDQGLSVIAVNADGQTVSETTLAAVRETVEKLRLTFPVLIDHGLAAFHDIGIIALPTTVILDRERLIKYELSGYPLVGSEEMADFVVAAIEGKKQSAIAAKKGYQPNKNALRLFNMGKNTLKSGRMADTAETWFKKAIEADPRFVIPHLSLGKFYLRKGEVSLAQTQFKEALVKEPDNVIALCESAMIMFNEGKLNEGRALLDRALKTDEYYTPCYYYAGFAYGRQGKLDEALKMFDEAARINPADYNIHVYQGLVYEERKKMPEAAAAYRKALEAAGGW